MVTKDLMPFKLLFETYCWIKDNTDFIVAIVAEGKSAEEWREKMFPTD